MKNCQLPKKNNVAGLKRIISITFIFAVVILVADSPIVETVDAIVITLSVVGVVAIAATVGYLLGRRNAENTPSSYEANDSGNDWVTAVNVYTERWKDIQNIYNTDIANHGMLLDSQYLYYGRLAENKVPSYIDEPVWNQAIKNNISLDLMTDYAGFISTYLINFDLLGGEMSSVDEAVYFDATSDMQVKYEFLNSAITGRFWPGGVKTFYSYEETGKEQYYMKDAFCLAPTGLTFQANITDLITNETFEIVANDLYLSDFMTVNPSLFSVEVTQGTMLIEGIRQDLDTTDLKWRVVNISPGTDAVIGTFNSANDWVTIKTTPPAPALSRKFFPVNSYVFMNDFISNISTIKSAIEQKAQIRYNIYKGFGYNSTSDIPIDEIIPPVDALFWDINQMLEMNETELGFIWLSYLKTLNETDYDTVETISVYDIPFTNANLLARLNITEYQTEYNATGNVTFIEDTLIWENRTVLIIPLEETLNLKTNDKDNFSQNVLMFDIDSHEFLNLVAFGGELNNSNVTSFEYEILELISKGETVYEGNYTITTAGDYIEVEYGFVPFIPSSAQGTTQLIWAYATIGVIIAGFSLYLLEAVPQLSKYNLSNYGKWLVYAGIISGAIYGIYYYVYPYLANLWAQFVGWLPW